MRLQVCKPTFPFQGRSVSRGDVVESRDYPDVLPDKWERLVQTGWFMPLEDDGSAFGGTRATRAAAEIARARGLELVRDPVVSEDAAGSGPADCPQCDFVAKTSHGLKVHTGRKHAS